ncbi:SIMPL domain-containing protein [Cystobacter fuscus]|uniref:SIMPL domain-containing protein n=1 Tax=Cystobacter fuscus TaxID=43 RepID=UPI002B2CEBBE|nr:SIMPL domain-containing protein [Cystobacter fuscus]
MDRRAIHISVGLIICTLIASVTWAWVRLHRSTTIDVRGSAKRRISSDLVQWAAVVGARDNTRVGAYTTLAKDVERTRQFLESQGVPAEQIRISSADVQELVREETLQEGSKLIQKQVFDGWHAQQRIEITSTDVPRIERLAREATQLLEKGITITSESPRYHYTKVSDLKIEMLAEASRDARLRAERMLEAAGGRATVGRVEGISTGVININAANSTETSWEGNYDTSSFEKDLITTVRVLFEVNN